MNEIFIKYSKCPRYEVSNLGNIRTVELKQPIKQLQGKSGYLRICPIIGSRSDGSRKTLNLKVHRMVAEVFVLNLANKETVNHKDGNKLNNNFLNLEWMTAIENIAHSNRNGRKSSYKPTKEHRRKMIDGWRKWSEGRAIERDSKGRFAKDRTYVDAMRGK